MVIEPTNPNDAENTGTMYPKDSELAGYAQVPYDNRGKAESKRILDTCIVCDRNFEGNDDTGYLFCPTCKRRLKELVGEL